MIFDNFFKLSFHWVELKKGNKGNKGNKGLELNQSKENKEKLHPEYTHPEYIHSGVHIQCVKQNEKMEIKCRTCYIKGRLCVPAKIHRCLKYSNFYLVS